MTFSKAASENPRFAEKNVSLLSEEFIEGRKIFFHLVSTRTVLLLKSSKSQRFPLSWPFVFCTPCHTTSTYEPFSHRIEWPKDAH
jgi:hypothetical protein